MGWVNSRDVLSSIVPTVNNTAVCTCVCVLVAQLCPTLCNPVDCSPPGPSVHEILQARILEWVAISFSRGSSQSRNQTHISCIEADSLLSEPPGKPVHLSVLLKYIYLFTYFWLCWAFLLHALFSSCNEQGLLSSCGAQASHCSGFSYAEHGL